MIQKEIHPLSYMEKELDNHQPNYKLIGFFHLSPLLNYYMFYQFVFNIV